MCSDFFCCSSLPADLSSDLPGEVKAEMQGRGESHPIGEDITKHSKLVSLANE